MKIFVLILVAIFMTFTLTAHQSPRPHYHQGGPNGPIVWGSWSPNSGGNPNNGNHHGGNNNGVDAQAQAQYDRGYKEGYRLGYQEGYENGLRDGEHAGRKQGRFDGARDGRHSIIDSYLTFDYGRDITDYSDKNVYVALDYGHSQAFKQGRRAGRNDGVSRGRADGYEKGKGKTYRKAYRRSYDQAVKQTHNEIFYRNGRKMNAREQLEIGMDFYQRRDFNNAIIHLNVIIRDMGNTPVLGKALWWAARTQMELDNKEYAALIYLQLMNKFPRHKPKAAMEAARVLVGLKSGGFIGIGRKTYYKQALICASIIVDQYFGSPEVAEALYMQGQCFEKLKKKNKAKIVYKKIVENYKTSPWAPKAKKRIKKLSSWW
ncbi:tetratricopeptide repeat protein [bacterium]|nr:tetratricopeptide repeat protein [bacterium]